MEQQPALRLVTLGSHPIVDRTSWNILAMGCAAAAVKTWDSVRLGLHPGLALLFTLLMASALLAYRHTRVRSGLCPTRLRVFRFWSLMGWVFMRTDVDVSGARSIKAQPIGRAQTQLAVELWLQEGFVELARVPSKHGEGVAEAEAICDRVARHLNIPNHGVQAQDR